ncbi:hypothetical protein MIND_00841200 [Mycena indigotica]|uniref:Uncharacterized protein n=1 Tax=Mycena indigotica TaxID=2126181 RepID=A0A8H6SIF4_9AGAR|nr:uncharacterized protein MIND_00841200 [Mycena indigotica]KAF7298932.1 hypothetical protein MIND_00841200 [Mycena indigotica]
MEKYVRIGETLQSCRLFGQHEFITHERLSPATDCVRLLDARVEAEFGAEMARLWNCPDGEEWTTECAWNFELLNNSLERLRDVDTFIVVPEHKTLVAIRASFCRHKGMGEAFPVGVHYPYRVILLDENLQNAGNHLIYYPRVASTTETNTDGSPVVAATGPVVLSWATCNDAHTWPAFRSHVHPLFAAFGAALVLARCGGLAAVASVAMDAEYADSLAELEEVFGVWAAAVGFARLAPLLRDKPVLGLQLT